MLGSLVALDLALFYVFWEVMLVPMYFIIGIWGGPRRIYASMKFFLFTMAGSLLMFLAILFLAIRYQAATGVWSFALEDLYRLAPFTGHVETLLFLAFALAFAIKVPVFPLHTWLPDAHTEAPTAGSIILAGVLLKLGVYGYLRFALPLFPDAAMHFAPWLGVLGVIGVVYGALVAYAQHDMKRLVAYSSVSHLGLVVIGVGAFTTMSLTGLDRPDDQPRPLDGRALPARRRPLRAPPHARARRLRRHRRRRARHDHALPDRHAVVDRPARPERLRRRVPHPARHVDLAPPLVGRRGRDRRDPVGHLHAHARAARLLEPVRARGEPQADRRPAERVHRGGRARRPHGLDRRPAQRRPRPDPPVGRAPPEGRRRQAAGRRRTRGAPRHDAGPREVHARRPAVDRAGDGARPDGLPHPARRGLRARPAPLVRDAGARGRGGVALLPARGPARHDVRRPLRHVAR